MVRGELGRMGWPAMRVKISRRCDQQQPDRAQPPRDQRGILQPGNPQREIETVGDEIDLTVAER